MKERSYRLWPWLLVLVAGLALSCLETKWLYPFHHTGYGIKPSSHIYSLAVIMLLFSQKVQAAFTSDNWAFNALAYLGRISFGLYLIHYYFIMMSSRYFPLNDWAWLTVIVLSFSVAFIYAVRRFIPAMAHKVGF